MPLPRRGIRRDRREKRRRRRNRPTVFDRRNTRRASEGFSVKDGIYYWDNDPKATVPAPKNMDPRIRKHPTFRTKVKEPMLVNRGGLVKRGTTRYKTIYDMGTR